MSSKILKVEGEFGLYRDTNSGGIIADDAAFARYKQEREKKLREISQEARINRLEEKMNEVQSDLGEILSILRSKNGNPTS
jgi:hypothetical protein